MEVAKENRQASAGIFVWTKSNTPPEVGNFKMIGGDFYLSVNDDLDQENSSFYLKAAITLSKALLVSQVTMDKSKNVDVDSIRLEVNSIINSLTASISVE